ncbi:MAG TPA: hypothetical protein PK595_04605 [Bacteroidota bacterium]|nr:hypothetical protein [Bacteroidota bacterium]
MKRITFLLLISPVLMFAQENTSTKLQTNNESLFMNDIVTVDGFYTKNLGEFGKIWKESVGAEGGYGYRVSNHFIAVFRTGLRIYLLNDDIKYDDASMTLLPLHVGGKLLFNGKRMYPYFSFVNGLNLIFQNTELDGTKRYNNMIKYHWQIGVGSIIMFNKKVGMDLSANYNNSFYKIEAMMTGFEYRLGIVYQLEK